MDHQTNIQELKNKVQKFCEERDWDQFHNPKDLAIGLITEASELLEHFRYKSDEEMKEIMKNPKKFQEVSEEAADILYMLLRFCQMNNIDLTTAFNKKLEKNYEKYPIEKSKGSNKKYNEF